MLTLSASTYKKDDFRAFSSIIETHLSEFINCSCKGSNTCSKCEYKKACYDIGYLYDYIHSKIK